MRQIITKTSSLKSVLKKLWIAVKANSFNNDSAICEMTLFRGKAVFAVPGAIFPINGETKGTAKVTFNLKHFNVVVKSIKDKEIKIGIEEEFISINIISIPAKACFFSDDNILKTIKLPINYNEADLLRLRWENYTDEELKFNGLTDKIYLSEMYLERDITETLKRLKIYGVEKEDLEMLINEKLKKGY